MQRQSENSPVDEKIESAIDRVIRGRMSAYGYKDASSRADFDSDGDPIIVVDVHYGLTKEPIDAAATFGLVTDVRDELAKLSEYRFPHIRHHFDERQKIAS